jgi:uncharacterized protein (TIGR02231 family)
MRRFLLTACPVLFLSATLSINPLPAAEVPSRVGKVVLYPDVAEVTRLVDVDAPTDTVVLSGLSPDLVPESISARTLAGNARIAGISSEDIFRTEAASERVKELERKLEELSDGRRGAEAGISDGRKEKELLEQGIRSVFSPGKEAGTVEKARHPRLTTGEIEASLSLFRTRAQAVDERILERERAVRDYDRKIAAVRQELDKIRPLRPRQEKVIRVGLARPATGRIAVSYLVSAAGFLPRYNVRLLPGAGTLSFELLGDAWQRTGEDWKEAAFTFSTGRPGRTAQLPPLPLPPWIVDFYVPPVVRPMMKMQARDAAPAGTAAAPSTAEAEAAEEALPSPERRFASFEVTLEGTHALAGSGEKTSFTLARRDQKAKVAWRSIPWFAEGAFLSAEGRNESGLPVLSSPAGLFVEDAYAGAGRLQDIPEGAEFTIDFGKDDSIRVRRREIERKREEGGVFSKVKRVRFRYEIETANHRKETAPVTVLDRIPVSRHKEIVVKDVEVTGGGKVGEAGEVRWEFPLAPGETRKLGLSFTVEYPADKEIHGL